MATTLVPVDRIRNGQPVAAEVVTTYRDDGHGLAALVICSGWLPKRNRWRSETTYRVEEVPTPLGRGFVLYRAPADVGPDEDANYGVLIAANGQDHTCTCRGYQAHGRCKHFDSVRGLIEGGHLDAPCADRRPAPWPYPEQTTPTGPAPF